MTTGDLNLELLKQKQDEGKAIASKPREPETTEEEVQVERTAPTMQTTEPDKEYALGDTIWK